MELKATKHQYHCETDERGATEYQSWDEFAKGGLKYDFDLNLPFRFDIVQDENTGEFILILNHAQQRHGQGLWHVIVHNLKQEDMPAVEAHLANCKNLMTDLWKEVPLNTISEPKSEKDSRLVIKRSQFGTVSEFELTEQEMMSAYVKMHRHYKIEDAVESLEALNLLSIDKSTLSEEQSDLLVKLEDAFEMALLDDMGVIWRATFDSYKDEIDGLFPKKD